MENGIQSCETTLPDRNDEATFPFLAYECTILKGLSWVFDDGQLFGECHDWLGEVQCSLRFVDTDAEEGLYSAFECHLGQCSTPPSGESEPDSELSVVCEETVCIGHAESEILNGILEDVSGSSSFRCSSSGESGDSMVFCTWEVNGFAIEQQDNIYTQCSTSQCFHSDPATLSPTAHMADQSGTSGSAVGGAAPTKAQMPVDGCPEGFSGESCGLCTTGEMCAARFAETGPSVNDELDLKFDCNQTPEFLSSSTDKSYECKVTNLQALFTGGIAWGQCHLDKDSEESKCRFQISQQQEQEDGSDGEVAQIMDCALGGCLFHQGSSSFECEDLSCEAFTEDNGINALIESLAGNSAFSCDGASPSADGTWACALNVDALPLGPIETTCLSRGCDVELVAADGTGLGLGGAGDAVSMNDTGTPLVSLTVFVMFATLGSIMITAGIKVGRLNKKIRGSGSSVSSVSKPGSHVQKAHVLTFTKVTATPEGKGRRAILSPPVTGSLLNGQMLALIGPSGSGKTTLLKAIAGVQNPGVDVGGKFLLDGRPFHQDKALSAFVKQHEILMETLTVRECILFSALLRMDPDLTVEEKVYTSDAIIEELGLRERANHLVSKLSGGQRRRVSIGQELVVSPSLLLLDEPTSGLDSHTASSLIKFLRSLCTSPPSSTTSETTEILKNLPSSESASRIAPYTDNPPVVPMQPTHEGSSYDRGIEGAEIVDLEDVLFSEDHSESEPQYLHNKGAGTATVAPELGRTTFASVAVAPTLERTVFDPVTTTMSTSNDIIARGDMERNLGKLRKADEDARLLLEKEEKAANKTGQRMVIMSIHQPSQSMFVQFDRLMCLSLGQVVYDGMASQAAPYMSKLGFDCPPSTPIPDFIIELISRKQSSAILVKAFQDDHGNRNERKLGRTRVTVFDQNTSTTTPLSVEITVLTWRSLINNWRNPSLFGLSIGLSLFLGLGCGLLFFGVTDDLAGFQNRTGAFYFMLTFFAFASLGSMDTFVSERHLFIHECEAGYFSVGSYFLAKTLLDAVLLRVIPSILFSFVFYWLVGLQPAFARFSTFLLALILFNVCTGSQAMVVGLLCKSVGTANVFAVCMFLFQLLFGGFLVNVQTLPSYIVWVEKLSVFSYAFEALMCNELQGLLLTLKAPGLPPAPIKGDIFLTTLGMNVDHIGSDLVLLFFMCACFFFIAYCVLVHHHHSTETKSRSRSTGVCTMLVAGIAQLLSFSWSIVTCLLRRDVDGKYDKVKEEDYLSDSDDGIELMGI
jgi:ABC-type multidrug transport system ATPase subunit